ncbi:MAG: hypothetical protein IV090_15640 [Candidatus Sericytochromatia bacterium]|nr:hypothetical protein [Candidatus Sericytochromatia bacterium]
MSLIIEDKKFATEVGSFFGKYLGTFNSAHKQVRADLFENSGTVVAYISFKNGLKPEKVTDPYLSPLKEFADQKYQGQIRLVLQS